MPRVNIPGVGAVNFPDTMTPEQITQAIETDILPKAQGAAQPQPAAPAPEAASGSPTGAPPLARAAKLLLAPVGEAVEFLDRFTGAPLRGGLSAVQDNTEADNLQTSALGLLPGNLVAFAKGAVQNIGSSGTPSMRDIAERGGVPTTALSEKIPGMYSETGEGAALKKGGFFDPTAAGAVGLAGDLVTPIPGLAEARLGLKAAGGVSRMAAKGTAAGVKGAAKGAAKAVDVATGTKAGSKTLEAVGDALQSTVDATKAVGKGIAKKYEGKYSERYLSKHARTIRENGLDEAIIPNSVKFGENSQASKFQRYEAEFLRPELAEAHDQGLRQIQEKVRGEIRKIGNSRNKNKNLEYEVPDTAEGAGEFLNHGFNRRVDEFFDNTETRYKTIAKKFPGLTIPEPTRKRLASNLARQEAKANELLKNSYDNASKAQAREFLEAVQQAKGATNSYADLVTALQGIGRTAFKNTPPGGITPPDKALFRAMYKDLSGVAMETVSRRVGVKTAKELADNNKKISEFINDKSVLSALADPKKGPDQAFASIFESGDVIKARALKRALTPEELQLVKASWLSQQIRRIETSDGEFTFRMLNNRLRNSKSQKVLNSFFDRGELDNLRNLVELGDEFGPKVLSTSGTGASNQAQALVDRASEGLVKNTTRAAVMGVNKGLAKRQERKAAENLAKSKGGGRIVSGPPGMNFRANGIAPKRMADLLRLKPRLQGQAAAYKNLNEEEDQ